RGQRGALGVLGDHVVPRARPSARRQGPLAGVPVGRPRGRLGLVAATLAAGDLHVHQGHSSWSMPSAQVAITASGRRTTRSQSRVEARPWRITGAGPGPCSATGTAPAIPGTPG